MHCKKLKAILSIKICILRQDIANEKKREGENLTSFNKCFSCSIGKKMRMNPHPKYDKDVRKLMRIYMPKPVKHELKTTRRKILNQKPTKYNLMGKA